MSNWSMVGGMILGLLTLLALWCSLVMGARADEAMEREAAVLMQESAPLE